MGNFIFNEYVNVFKRNEDYIADGDSNIGVALISSCPFNCTYKSLDSIREYVAKDYNITIPEIYGIKSLDGVELAYNEIGVDANVLVKALPTIFEGETWFSACGCVIFRNKDGSSIVSDEYPTGETELVSYYDFGEQVVTSGSPFKIYWKGSSELDSSSKGTVIVYTPELTDIYEAITNSGKVRVSEDDPTPDYLLNKLSQGKDISIEETEDHRVKITYMGEEYITSATDTDTIALTVTSGELTAEAKISETSGNILTNDGGLFVPKTEVPEDYITSATDTHSVLLEVDDHTLSAIVNISESSGNYLTVKEDGLFVGGEIPEATSADKKKILTPDENGELHWEVLSEIRAPSATIEATEGTTLVLDGYFTSAHAEQNLYETANQNIVTSAGNRHSTSASFQIDRTAPYITDTVANKYVLVTGQGTGLAFSGGQLGIDGSTLAINETVGITETTSGSMELKGLRFSAEAYASSNQGTKYESNPSQAEIWSRNPSSRGSLVVANEQVIANVRDNNGVYSSVDIRKNGITATTSGDADHYVTVRETSSDFGVSVACTPNSNSSPCNFTVGNNSVRSVAENISLIASNLPNRPSASIVFGLPMGGTTVMMTSAGIEANTVNLTVNSTSAIGVSATNENSVYSDSVFIRNSHWYDDEEERGGYRNFVGMNSNGVSLETESLKVIVRDKEGTDEWSEHAEINAVHDGNLVLKKTDGYETSGFLVIGNTKSELFAINENDVRTSYSVSTSSLGQNANFTETNYYESITTSAYQTNILNGDISTYPYIQNAVYTTSSDGSVTTTKYSYQVIHNGGISLYSNAQGSISLQWNGTNESGSVQLGSFGTQNAQIFGRNGVKISALNDNCRVYLGWSDTIVHGTNAFLETNNDQIGVTNSGVNVNAKNPIYIHTETGAPVEVRSGATSGSYSRLQLSSGSATIRAEELNLVASSTNENTPIVNVVASSGDITFVSSNMMINAATRLTPATSADIVDVEDQDHGSDDLNGILATSYAGGQMFRFGVKKDTIRTSATADNETIPTEKAVRAAIDAASGGGTEWYCGSFTTANRPSNPTEGQYGYDTTIDCVIYYIGGEWKNSAGATV